MSARNPRYRLAKRVARHVPDAKRILLPLGIAQDNLRELPGQGAGADPTYRAALAFLAKGCVSTVPVSTDI